MKKKSNLREVFRQTRQPRMKRPSMAALEARIVATEEQAADLTLLTSLVKQAAKDARTAKAWATEARALAQEAREQTARLGTAPSPVAMAKKLREWADNRQEFADRFPSRVSSNFNTATQTIRLVLAMLEQHEVDLASGHRV